MNRAEFQFILGVLQNKKTDIKASQIDWYSVLGFLELHKITGPFYHAVRMMDITIPQQVLRKLASIVRFQVLRNSAMQEWALKISAELNRAYIEHAFLKGSILNSACIYRDGFVSPYAYLRTGNEYGTQATLYNSGDRISNDIDLLIEAKNISKVDNVLRSLGFVQGYWDFSKDNITELSRTEIISRRMNRGETAPYMQKIDSSVVPFIEVDVNFSIDYLPVGNEELLKDMLSSVRKYDNGLSSLSATFFFIHLLLHQYKEMTVLSMVKRNKDIELYKYLDIYKIIKAGLIGWPLFFEIARKYNIEVVCVSVLKNAMTLFDTLQIDLSDCGQTFVLDPENGNKKYVWTKSLKARMLHFDSVKFLREADSDD